MCMVAIQLLFGSLNHTWFNAASKLICIGQILFAMTD